MKIPTYALILLALFASPVAAQQKSITVRGFGQATAQPDAVIWRISTTDPGHALLNAMRNSDERRNKLLQKAKELGVDTKDIRLDRPKMERKMVRDKNNQERPYGYRVHRTITVKQGDLARFDEFLESFASRQSENESIEFRFETSKMDELRQAALKNAIRDARKKAVLLAQEMDAGFDIPKPIRVRVLDMPSIAESRTNDNLVSFGSSSGAIIVRQIAEVTFGVE